MSARTPFNFGGAARPASRVSQKNDQNVNPAQHNAHSGFPPDPLNPLNAPKSPVIHKAPGAMDMNLNLNLVQKPLNLNGLSKNPGSGPARTPSRQQGTTRRLESPSTNEQLRRELSGPLPLPAALVTPTPRLANRSTPPVFVDPNANPSVFSASSRMHPPQPQEKEKMHLSLSLSKGGPPPQRIPVGEGNGNGDQAHSRVSGLMGNRRKRPRADADEGLGEEGHDDDHDLVYLGAGPPGVAKRYKPQPQPQGQQQLDNPEEMDYMRHSFSPQPFSSPVPESGGARPGSDYPGMSQPNGRGFLQETSQQIRGSQTIEGNSLDKLLGCYANMYVDEHMGRYQQLATKWQDCTLEEWKKGAEEIMTKYTKVLDFVKKHMESKIKLLASFDAHIENHKVVLGERAELLDDVRQKLVTNSNTVLVGGSSANAIEL